MSAAEDECTQDTFHADPDFPIDYPDNSADFLPGLTANASAVPSTTATFVRRRPRSVVRDFLRQRELGGTTVASAGLTSWAEGESLRNLDVGTYVRLGRSSRLVRSTISIAFSHDGQFFASTHGDHSVKVFSYPLCNLIASLEGHPRTPWSVRFHPTNPSIIASGCLGGECRVWDVSQKRCIAKHVFQPKISCVAFSPAGDMLAVTAGAYLQLWRYRAAPPQPRHSPPDPFRSCIDEAHSDRPTVLLSGGRDYHMVDFHPSGRVLLTGESNRTSADAGRPAAPEEQFTLRLVAHSFDPRSGVLLPNPALVIPRAVAYNDAGVHISACGTRLAACVPVAPGSRDFHIAVLALTAAAGHPPGTVLFSTPLDAAHVAALTNLKFSASGAHLLAGFSFPRGNPVLRAHADMFDITAALNAHGRASQCGAPARGACAQVRVVDIFRVCPEFPLVRSLRADLARGSGEGGGGGGGPTAEDEINIAVFAPGGPAADGVLYGTQKGRIRVFRHAAERAKLARCACDANCAPPLRADRVSGALGARATSLLTWPDFPGLALGGGGGSALAPLAPPPPPPPAPDRFARLTLQPWPLAHPPHYAPPLHRPRSYAAALAAYHPHTAAAIHLHRAAVPAHATRVHRPPPTVRPAEPAEPAQPAAPPARTRPARVHFRAERTLGQGHVPRERRDTVRS